ncbi:MAG: hypothetical protein MJ182_05755 [Treponema sp.]|nr:hypothetical protein [Treponema sp.]
MKVCPKCGTKYENGNFCENCETEDGNPVRLEEQKISCPQCGKLYSVGTKFCSDCGVKLGASAPQNNAGISMGDKNVVAGDIIGKKEETNISGNATIIKNEDETKKTAKCHVCGRIVLRLEGYDCPVCGEFTCKNCYVPEIGKCTSCRDSSGNEKEEVYKQAVERILADGKIDMSERKELMSLQTQLGISSSRALELENIVKNNISSGKGINDENALGTFDKLTFENAQKLLYDEGKANDALNLIEPLYKKYSLNEDVLGVYLNSLVKVDSAKALSVIKTFQADVLCAKLTEIDIASENKNYSLVEEKLNQAEKFWADSVLLKCRKIEFYKNLTEVSGDTSYIMLAKELLDTCGKGTTKLEKSYIVKSERMIKKLLEEELPELTDELCESLQVYKNVVGVSEINYKELIGMPEAELLELEAKTHNPKVQYALWYFYHSIQSRENEFVWAEKSASQGDIDGKAALGYCYLCAYGCEENIDKGLALVNEAAKKERIEAYFFLGRYYDCQQDYAKAVEWYKKSAEQGFALGQNNLGLMYENGQGVPQDYAKAVDWYKKSAEQGFAISQNNLGDMYEYGKGVPQDYAKAVDWYKKSAEQGNASAQCNLGYMYEYGKGVPQDYAKAVDWYKKSAEQGNARAQNHLGDMYEYGQGVPQDYVKAVEWYKKSAEQGNAYGQNHLGDMYEYGKGVPQDYAKAVEWYKKSAEQGNSLGQAKLGDMYEDGKGVPQDYVKAVEWYKKSAEQGNAISQNNLGVRYEKGQGVSQDYAKAVEWFMKSAEQGNAYGQANLGGMYLIGQGVPQDYAKAVEWFMKSAEQGNADGQANLGYMYEYGEGVPQDYAKAVEWYTKSAEQGNSYAKRRLEEIST